MPTGQGLSRGVVHKIGQLNMPAEVHAVVLECIQEEADRLLESQGMRAFEMPRTAAIGHETGHAIVATVEGHQVTSVKISRQIVFGMTVWTGVTNDSHGPWSITPETPTAEVLSRVRCLIAGVVGEAIYAAADYRAGSSLDEIVLAQMALDNLLQLHPDEFAVAHPKEIWSDCLRQTASILKHNENVARDLMAKLDHSELVKGKPLRAVLRRVGVFR
jgi:hypothetical protein